MTDWDEALAGYYRQAIDEVRDGEGNSDRGAAIERVVPLVEEALASGMLTLPGRGRFIRAELRRLDEADDKAAGPAIRMAVAGQIMWELEGDRVLDLVVTLGQGRRRKFRDVDSFALQEMDQLRYKNLRAQQLAYDEWRVSSYDPVAPLLLRYANLGAVAEAGAFVSSLAS